MKRSLSIGMVAAAWPLLICFTANAAAQDAQVDELKRIRAELGELRKEVGEQKMMIQAIYDFMNSEMGLEARRKEQEQDQRLRMDLLHEIEDPVLASRGVVDPTAPLFAVLTRDGNVRIYDTDGAVTKTLDQPGEIITAVSYASDGKRLLTGTQSGKLLVWNLHTGGCETVADNLGSAVGRVAWLAGVERLVWGSTVRYWSDGSQPINRDKLAGGVIDRATGKRCWTFQSFIRDDYQTLSAAPDGGRLAVLEIPGKPRGAFLLDSSSGKLLATLFHEQHACGPLSVCIGPNSDTVAVGYAPTDVIVWDASRQDVIQILEGHTNWVVSLAFSKDGRFLISGAGDSTARVWDWRVGKEIGRIRFPGTCSYVESVGFSPGGDTAFALSAGRLVIARTPKPGVTVR